MDPDVYTIRSLSILQIAHRKGDLDVVPFGGKLQDCKEKDPSICEIFLVEGDSAGGSALKLHMSCFDDRSKEAVE